MSKHETPEKKHETPEQPPACEPQLGDLTPAYIEWFRKNHADEFEGRYKGRIAEELLKHKPKEAK